MSLLPSRTDVCGRLPGLIIAHQNLDQFDQKLRATVLSSTSIKLVGGVSAKDAGVFAKEMNCEPEFLQNMRKGRGSTQFAFRPQSHASPHGPDSAVRADGKAGKTH